MEGAPPGGWFQEKAGGSGRCQGQSINLRLPKEAGQPRETRTGDCLNRYDKECGF